MIAVNKDILYALCDNGAFILINSVISNATCQLYNEIFQDVYFYNELYIKEKKNKRTKGLYEIQRKYFDPEVIFREKRVIELGRKNIVYKKGIYEKIYNECHILRKLFEFNIGECLDLLLYKRTVFMNEDLELLIREKKIKAIKGYKNGLECGRTADKSYLFLLIQMLDEEKSKRDACLSLYYYIELIDENKHFTEMRIRRIFECLEKECTLECELNCEEKEETYKVKNIEELREENRLSPIYYDSDIVNITMEDKIIEKNFNKKNNGNFEKEKNIDNDYMSQIKEGDGSICSYNSEESLKFSIIKDVADDNNKNEYEEENNKLTDKEFDINLCDRLRIIKLIKHLYGLVEKIYFFKPSYLILMKSQIMHCLAEREFLNLYFQDFVWFVEHGKNNIAKALFVEIKKMKSKEKNETNIDEINIDGIEQNELIYEDDSEDELLIDRINKMKSANNL